MKLILNTSSILSLVLFAFTGCYTPMDLAPDYDEVSAIVTPKGKTLSSGSIKLIFPPGAVTENTLIEWPTWENVIYDEEDGIPNALFRANDEMVVLYSSKMNLLPNEVIFQKPVGVSFNHFAPLREHYIFDLTPGSDPSVPMNWAEVTVKKTEDNSGSSTSLIYEFSTSQFTSYIIGDGSTKDSYMINNFEHPSFPYYSEKPKLSNGKYNAFILDLSGSFFYLNVAFIKQPVNNQSFKVYNAYKAGAFNNTNPEYAEVRGGFVCNIVNSTLYCGEIHSSESGIIKYLITTESGQTVHKLLLKGVVVKDPETGRKNEFNGYIRLGV